jgi:TetR/AcrR family transcriptional regulator, transcriptional repressor for nem operon
MTPEPRSDQTMLAAVQGGLVLTQTRRDSRALAVALDTALAYIHTFAA